MTLQRCLCFVVIPALRLATCVGACHSLYMLRLLCRTAVSSAALTRSLPPLLHLHVHSLPSAVKQPYQRIGIVACEGITIATARSSSSF